MKLIIVFLLILLFPAPAWPSDTGLGGKVPRQFEVPSENMDAPTSVRTQEESENEKKLSIYKAFEILKQNQQMNIPNFENLPKLNIPTIQPGAAESNFYPNGVKKISTGELAYWPPTTQPVSAISFQEQCAKLLDDKPACIKVTKAYMDLLEIQYRSAAMEYGDEVIKQKLEMIKSSNNAIKLQVELNSSNTSIMNKYNEWTMQYTAKAFEEQLQKSKIIFNFVIAIVSIGLMSSLIHFAKDVFFAKRPSPQNAAPVNTTTSDNQPEQHKAKFGTTGLEISSSAIGLMIFMITIVFFYLYVVHIYPIKPVI